MWKTVAPTNVTNFLPKITHVINIMPQSVLGIAQLTLEAFSTQLTTFPLEPHPRIWSVSEYLSEKHACRNGARVDDDFDLLAFFLLFTTLAISVLLSGSCSLRPWGKI